MNYTREEFFDLMEEAEAQGSLHLETECRPVTYVFEVEGKERPVTLKGCGNATLFDVPYESDVGIVGTHMVNVCAVDDSMGRWPRFGGDRFARVEEEE